MQINAARNLALPKLNKVIDLNTGFAFFLDCNRICGKSSVNFKLVAALNLQLAEASAWVRLSGAFVLSCNTKQGEEFILRFISSASCSYRYCYGVVSCYKIGD